MAVTQVFGWGLAFTALLALVAVVIGWTVIFVCGINGMHGHERIEVIKAMAAYLRALWPWSTHREHRQPSADQGYVFISYSRRDQAYVNRLVRYLERNGLAVWVDRDIRHGDRWRTVIQRKIDKCSVLLVVMTRHAENSEWVDREIARAQRRGKPILPLLRGGEPFLRLENVQHESVRGGRLPTRTFVGQLQALTGSAPVRQMS